MKDKGNPILNILRRIRRTLIKEAWWIPIRRTPTVVMQFPLRIIATALGLAIVPGGLTYNQDGLATGHNCDFMQDQAFMKAYRVGLATGSWGYNVHLEWRVFVVCWAAQQAMHLDGDFVECGVNRGGLARSLIDFVEFEKSKKTFYLLDTFCGLVDSLITPAEKKLGKKPGGFVDCYDEVCNTFKQFPNVVIIRGVVPETLPLVKAERVAFLSIDMNCAEPEIAAGEFFWDKLVPGAIIVLDDYSDFNFIEQKHAWDRFARTHDTMVLNLPTGQGLIVKH